MTTFKVGDRVAVYGATQTGYSGVVFERKTGTIKEIEPARGAWFNVLLDGAKQTYTFHPKQCRLVKKKERRRMWISEMHLEHHLKVGDPTYAYSYPDLVTEPVEFVEVRKKK